MDEFKNQNNQINFDSEIKQIIKELPLLLNKFCFEYEEFNKEYSEDIFEELKINNTKGFSKQKIELWKEETRIDKIQETLERNIRIIKTETLIRKIINQLTSKFDSFKESIYDKNKLLIEKYNESCERLNKLEDEYNKTIGEINNNEKEISKMKTIEEEQHEKDLMKLNDELKESLKFEEMKQLEELVDLPIERIIFDSETEGNEGSEFQESVMNKNNLIFFIESEEGDRFGVFLK